MINAKLCKGTNLPFKLEGKEHLQTQKSTEIWTENIMFMIWTSSMNTPWTKTAGKLRYWGQTASDSVVSVTQLSSKVCLDVTTLPIPKSEWLLHRISKIMTGTLPSLAYIYMNILT